MLLRNYKLDFKFLFYVLIALMVYAFDQHYAYTRMLRSAVLTAASPLYLLVDMPFGYYFHHREAWRSVASLQAENQAIKKENLTLKALLRKFNALYFENDRLRALLKSSKQFGDSVLMAEILSVDSDPSVQRIILNKGSREGVFVDQVVLDANGVLGQVVEVSPWSCVVLLMTDVDHAIPVYILRNNVRAIAVGLGIEQQLELMNLPNTADVRSGDMLISSGLGQRFPAGYPVGTVISVEKNQALAFAKVLVKPVSELSRLREVLLLWPQGEVAGVKKQIQQVPLPAQEKSTVGVSTP
jgi:rod shape-determining protein MreC